MPAGVALQSRPAVVLAPVDVDRIAIRLLAGTARERRRGQASQVVDQRPPLRQPRGIAQVAEHDLLALAVELDVTSGRQEREPVLDLRVERAAPAIDERDEPPVEAELPVLLADQIDHGQVRLALGAPQAAPELLGEHRRAVRRSQQQHGVDARDVDALAEHVDREHRPQLSDLEPAQRRVALALGRLAGQRDATRARRR